jgi:glycosyltransferase involved in cell wall biosynthesis
MREALSRTLFNLRSGRQFDIVHYTRPIAYPFFWRLADRCVVTIHDAGYIVAPRMRDDVGPLAPPPGLTKRLYNWTLRRFSHKIDAAIVVSQWSKAEVARHYRVPEERIHVVYNAPDPIFRPLPDRERLRAELASRYGVPESFVLCVGRIQPHKNIRGLLRAWARVEKGIRSRHPLVIIGRRYWRYEDVFELAQSLGLAGEVVFLEQFIPDEDLARFYNAAELFVFPSLFEGFGLPLVEALACGAPTVSSNAASMPEVAGEAALLVDPRDPDAMAAAIGRVLGDRDLRQELSRRALEQARKFTWEASARQVLGIYRALMNEQRANVAPHEAPSIPSAGG